VVLNGTSSGTCGSTSSTKHSHMICRDPTKDDGARSSLPLRPCPRQAAVVPRKSMRNHRSATTGRSDTGKDEQESQAMDIQYASRTRKNGDGAWPCDPPRVGRSGRWVRWLKRAMSASLLTTATVIGVQLGLGAPAVSPVSPAAIAARANISPSVANVTTAMHVWESGRHHSGGDHA
jgi:hypothetical protein